MTKSRAQRRICGGRTFGSVQGVDSVSVADLKRDGVVFTTDEVVSIAQRLVYEPSTAIPEPPFGPLAADRVCIASDGSVTCRGCAATPSVAELAILLQDLLTAAPHVPGGLRYAIARALHEVDAPPFDSIEEFVAAIARYAPSPRADATQQLLLRRDRRRLSPSRSDLRRQLREADRRLYESQLRADTGPPVRAPARGWALGALIAAAVTMMAAAGMVGDGTPPLPAVMAPPAAVSVLSIVPNSGETIHPIFVGPPARTRPVRPVRESRPRELRFRWFHKTIEIRNDLTRP